MTSTRFALDPVGLAALAARLGVTPGPLSPWTAGATPDGGTVDGELRAALTSITTATAAAWVRLVGAGRSFEYGAWFAPDGTAAALCPNADAVVVEVPPAADLVAVLTVDVLGASAIRGVALDLELSPLHALLLGVVIDEARRDALLASAMGMPFVPRGVVAADAARLRSDLATGGTGVTALVAAAHGDPFETPSAGAVLDAFAELVGSGHVTEEGGRFVPAGTVRALAPRCLVCTAQLTLTAGWITGDGTVARAGVHAAQFGVHDVVVAERVGATLRLATEPAATLTEDVRAFIGGAPVALSV